MSPASVARLAAGASLLLLAPVLACLRSPLASQASSTAPVAPAPPAQSIAPRTSAPPSPAPPPAPPSAPAVVSRNGNRFTETTTGVESVDPRGRLLVSARGPVSVEGSDEPVVRYTVTKRVGARSDAEARRQFQQYRVRASRSGDLTKLDFQHGGDDLTSAELIVTVPRGLKEVLVETHGGSVEATDLRGRVKAETGGGRMALDRIGGEVIARTSGGDITLGTIGGPILARTSGGTISAAKLGGAATLVTAGGNIDVAAVEGALSASTAGGGIRIQHAGATVKAETAGGAIDVRSARGQVIASNHGGPVDIGASDGAEIETAGGTIRLGAVSGNVQASTAVGNIHAYLARGLRIEAGTLVTGSGDITVYIPVGYPITIQAENAASSAARAIVSDFPLTIRTAGSVAVAEGKIGGGGPLLRLSGMGGTISIKKREGSTREE